MTDINVAYRLQMFNSTEQYPSLLYSNKIMKKEFKKQFQEKFQEEFNKVFDEAFEKRFSELFDKYYEKKVNNKVVSKYISYFSYLYIYIVYPFTYLAGLFTRSNKQELKTEKTEPKTETKPDVETTCDKPCEKNCEEEIECCECECGYEEPIKTTIPKIYPRERKSEQIMMQEDNDEYSGSVYKLKNGPKDKEAPSKLFKEFENARNQLVKEVYAEMNGTSDYPPNSDIPDGDIHDN